MFEILTMKGTRMNIHSLKNFIFLLLLGLLFTVSCSGTKVAENVLVLEEVSEPVEIITDQWGISHIFAQNQKDLFFAQGFNVARDRLFQLEIWRRQATGTLAEILGPKALPKDIGARLLKARVDMKQEMAHYHPQGEEIITSFVRGINAYIDHVHENPALLPLELKLLGIEPEHWTAEVVVSRHNGLFRNLSFEVRLARSVKILGADRAKKLLNLHPGDPDLKVEEGIDLSLIHDEILELYYASRSYVRFSPEDIAAPSFHSEYPPSLRPEFFQFLTQDIYSERYSASNNWVVKGNLTATGQPMMANDPHRRQQIPSLRYWVHLVAPGWNVIGGGEPALPGVSIGHNEYGAWGLTIFPVDQEDLYVYDLHPENTDQYKYRDRWEEMDVIKETIRVKGQADVSVDLKFTRHGPVLHVDEENLKAFALKAAWLEIGCAPYLASLRMDQAQSWEEFREACSFSRTPSENMVWADVDNNIGWQAVGIAPIRSNWNGLLPVPGDGRYEWEGYFPIKNLPHTFNPPEHFFATANQDNVPGDYPYSVGFIWTDPFRFSRLTEVLSSGDKFTMTGMMNLQQDFLSLPARSLVPLLEGLSPDEPRIQEALDRLLSWDYVMNPDSIEAAIYMSWMRRLSRNVWNLYLPKAVRSVFPQRSLARMISFLESPDEHFGSDPIAARNAILLKSLKEAISDLDKRFGPDINTWKYGHEKFHHILIRHMMSGALDPELRAKFDVGPLPRGGNDYTVNKTSNTDNQTSGASFRIIADLADWDNSKGTNCPGQSGNPDSPHYADLFNPWAKGNYFPVYFTRDKIMEAAEILTLLKPRQ